MKQSLDLLDSRDRELGWIEVPMVLEPAAALAYLVHISSGPGDESALVACMGQSLVFSGRWSGSLPLPMRHFRSRSLWVALAAFIGLRRREVGSIIGEVDW